MALNKESKMSGKVSGISRSLLGMGLIVLTALVAFIPTWLYLLARAALEPTGFWQNLILFGLGMYFVGALQLILFVVGVFVIFYIVLWAWF